MCTTCQRTRQSIRAAAGATSKQAGGRATPVAVPGAGAQLRCCCCCCAPQQTYYFDKKTHPPAGPEDDEHEVSSRTLLSNKQTGAGWSGVFVHLLVCVGGRLWLMSQASYVCSRPSPCACACVQGGGSPDNEGLASHRQPRQQRTRSDLPARSGKQLKRRSSQQVATS